MSNEADSLLISVKQAALIYHLGTRSRSFIRSQNFTRKNGLA